MADPLSAAASIVGILTAAQGISVCITKLVSKAKKPPEEMMELKTTVDTIHAVLSQLQSLLLGQVRLNHARTALVLVDQIVIALSACVNVFSGLDVLVRSLENEESLKVVERLRWMAKSGEIKEQLQKLEMQKSSLTLMLTILTCESNIEANTAVTNLEGMISRVLENQQILAQRLSLNDTQPMLEPAGIEESESSPTSSQRAKQSEDDTIIKRFAFQEDLESSRVYIRSSWKEDESFSINSQSLTTTVRSLMSDVSLEDISNISVVALPIYAEDLSNKQDYDFKNAIKSRSPKTAQRKNERGAISDGTTLIATMEYNIEDLGIKIKTSGHGLVAELMARNLSQQDLIWVVPCVGDIEYPIDQPSEPMTVRIGQRIVHVSVHYYKANSITWVLLDSPIFRMCTKSEPYPDMFDESALAKRLYGPKDADLVTTEYYSTWNQCIAQIIKRLSPVCYLIMDHRAALAPLYLLPKTIACILIYNRAQQTASTSHPVSQLPPPYSGAIYSRLTLYSPSTL